MSNRSRNEELLNNDPGDNELFELIASWSTKGWSTGEDGTEPRNRGGAADGFRGCRGIEGARLLGVRENAPVRNRPDSALQVGEVSAFSLVDHSGVAGKPRETMTCCP